MSAPLALSAAPARKALPEREIDHKETTLAITLDMTPQQAAEAFAATIRGAVVEGLEDGGSEDGESGS